MADFSLLKAHIDARIYENTSQAITGAVLNETLKEMVDEVNAKKSDNIPIANSIPAGGMLPNVYYDLGILPSTQFTLELADGDPGKYNEWFCSFVTSSYGSVVFSSKITEWFGGDVPSLLTNKRYQLYVRDGMAILGLFQ